MLGRPISSCLTEFDLEKTLKNRKKEGIEEGVEIGRKEGREEGKVITMVELIANGTLSLDDAASAIGMSKAHFIDAANRLGLKLK